MRILHLTDSYAPRLGGIEAHVAALARRQAAAGADVTVSTLTPHELDGRTMDDHGCVVVHRMRSARAGPGEALDSFDVVHAHVSVFSLFAAPLAAAAARRGVPTVVTVHSLWGTMGPLPTLAIDAAALRRAPVVWTAVSRLAAEQVAARLPRGSHVHVLPNAVSVSPRFSTPGTHDHVSLVSTMRLARRKRPLALVDAFADLRSSTEVPVRLTIVGDGGLRSSVERRAARRGVHSLVTVTGRVEPGQVLTLLAESDVYVAPAELESFGLAALEARCLGLPVAGRSHTGLADFIEHDVHGLLCDSDRALVGALRLLVERPDVRRRISEHNRTTSSEMTWTNTLGRHEHLYGVARGVTDPARAPLPAETR